MVICDKMAPLELEKWQCFYAHIKVQLDCLIWGKRPSVCILEIICIIDFQTSLKATGIYHLNCDRQNVCPCYFIKIIVIALWIPGVLSRLKFVSVCVGGDWIVWITTTLANYLASRITCDKNSRVRNHQRLGLLCETSQGDLLELGEKSTGYSGKSEVGSLSASCRRKMCL